MATGTRTPLRLIHLLVFLVTAAVVHGFLFLRGDCGWPTGDDPIAEHALPALVLFALSAPIAATVCVAIDADLRICGLSAFARLYVAALAVCCLFTVIQGYVGPGLFVLWMILGPLAFCASALLAINDRHTELRYRVAFLLHASLALSLGDSLVGLLADA